MSEIAECIRTRPSSITCDKVDIVFNNFIHGSEIMRLDSRFFFDSHRPDVCMCVLLMNYISMNVSHMFLFFSRASEVAEIELRLTAF